MSGFHTTSQRATPALTLVFSLHGKCIEALESLTQFRAITNVPLELVIVDNASTDDTARHVLRYWPSARLVARSDASCARGVPYGLAAARTPYVALLDSREILSAGILEAMYAYVRKTPRCIATAFPWDAEGAYGCPVPMREHVSGWPVVNLAATVAGRAWLMRQADFALRFGLAINPADAALEAMADGYAVVVSPEWKTTRAYPMTEAERRHEETARKIDQFEAITRHFLPEEAQPLLQHVRAELHGEPILADRYDPFNPPPQRVRSIVPALPKERFVAWVQGHSFPEHGACLTEPVTEDFAVHPRWMVSRRAEAEGASWPYRPVVTFVMAICEVHPKQLQACLDALVAQTYSHWMLCAVDDGTGSAACRGILKRFEHAHPSRVRVIIRKEKRGRNATLHEALSMAHGQYVGILDACDYLVPQALAWMVDVLNDAPQTDWLYGDEAVRDHDGVVHEIRKPDWSPELFLGTNYPGRLSIWRRAMVLEAGGFLFSHEHAADEEMVRGVADADDERDEAFLFRMAAAAQHIRHIPEIMLWRHHADAQDDAPAFHEDVCLAETVAARAQADMLIRENYLAQQGIDGRMDAVGGMGARRYVMHPKTQSEAVDVVVFGAVHGAGETADAWKSQHGIRVGNIFLAREGESAARTLARALASVTASNFFVMETGTVPIGDDTLARLSGWCHMPHVGMASVRCLFGDRIDHCGLTLGSGGDIGFSLRGRRHDDAAVQRHGDIGRNVAALSPAATLVHVAALRACGEVPAALVSIEGVFLWWSLAMRARAMRLVADGSVSTGRMTPFVFAEEALPGGADHRFCLRHFPILLAGGDPFALAYDGNELSSLA